MVYSFAERVRRQHELDTDVERVAASLSSAIGRHRLCTLSDTEQHVLALIGLGFKNVEIADGMRVAFSTIRTHVKSIHDKSEIVGRARLAIVAHRLIQQNALRA